MICGKCTKRGRQFVRTRSKLEEQQLKRPYGDKYSSVSMSKNRQEASRLLNEEVEKRTVVEKVSPYQKNVIEQCKKKKKCGRS